MVKHVFYVTKRGISSHTVDPDREVKAKENGGLTPGSQDMINMKWLPTTEIKMMTPTGSNMNSKYCSVKVFVQA